MSDIEPGEPHEYKIDPEVERDISREIVNRDWTLDFSGSIECDQQGKPVVDEINSDVGYRSKIVYYETDKLVIKNKRDLDILALVPEDWKLEIIGLANIRYASPEVIRYVYNYHHFDLENQRILIGDMNEGEGLPDEKWVRILLWNVFTSRAINRMGIAGNQEALKRQRALVEEKREEVLRALKGESNLKPQEVASKSFR